MKDNKGFSLVTVIIAVAFIGILGMLVLYIALQNFNMKTAGIKGKDGFYTAEQALEGKAQGLSRCQGFWLTKVCHDGIHPSQQHSRRKNHSRNQNPVNPADLFFIIC